MQKKINKKVRIGVLGGYRGGSMINYCKRADNAELVAICDHSPEVLQAQKEMAKGLNIAFYTDYDEFLNHDMDAVVLANYATEHAPFAVKALKKGLHVYSEVEPCQTMKEAVELIETVEETGKIYSFGENYCYMAAPYEMRRLYREGKLGEFIYGEGEYVHNGEPIWHAITYGEREHWRNRLYSTYYCTHSLGPIIHMTGLRPVSVIGVESEKNERPLKVGSSQGLFSVALVTLENGGIVKNLHGWLYEDSIWWSIHGSKGRVESPRSTEDFEAPEVLTRVNLRADEAEGEYKEKFESYIPERPQDHIGKDFGHGGSDFYVMWHFCEKIKGNPEADVIDVYEAMDMFLPGMFAYRSILKGSVPVEIPNLRNKAERDLWRNDTACTDPNVAGDMLLPPCKAGFPDIPEFVYDKMKQKWEDEKKKPNGNYRAKIFAAGAKKE